MNKINFTRANIEKIPLPAQGKRMRIYDEQVRGLLIEVTSSGRRTFYFRRKQAGKSYWERIGPFEHFSIEEARAAAFKLNSRASHGETLRKEKEESTPEPTLKDIFDAYIGRHASKKRKTWEIMIKDFQRTLSHWAGRSAARITAAEVEQLHRLLEKTRGLYTANRTLQLLRAVYNKARLWKLISGDNPAAGITLFEEKARQRFLSKDEVKKLFEALDNLDVIDPQQRTTRDFVLLALLTGARKSNIAAMRFSDIKWDEAIWIIPETKNGTPQAISLTVHELEILRERRGIIPGDFVFPGPGAKGHIIDLKRSWLTLRKNAGLADVTLHDLRRNLGSWMASQNVNVALIKGALNHKDIKTTLSVYALTAKEAERQGREVAHMAMYRAAGFEPRRKQS